MLIPLQHSLVFGYGALHWRAVSVTILRGSRLRSYLQAPFGGAKAADEAKDNLCDSYSSMSSILDHLTFCKGKNHDKLHAGCSSIVRQLAVCVPCLPRA